jgi:hypothetical protein
LTRICGDSSAIDSTALQTLAEIVPRRLQAFLKEPFGKKRKFFMYVLHLLIPHLLIPHLLQWPSPKLRAALTEINSVSATIRSHEIAEFRVVFDGSSAATSVEVVLSTASQKNPLHLDMGEHALYSMLQQEGGGLSQGQSQTIHLHVFYSDISAIEEINRAYR